MKLYKIVSAASLTALEKLVQSLLALGYDTNGRPFGTGHGEDTRYAQAIVGNKGSVHSRTVSVMQPELPEDEPIEHKCEEPQTFTEIAQAVGVMAEGGDAYLKFNSEKVDGSDYPLTDGILRVYNRVSPDA